MSLDDAVTQLSKHLDSTLVALKCPTCFKCGETAVILVPHAQLVQYRQGALAQQAFPQMSPDEREMFISGTHPACWEKMFG